jgi:hypothetical protein
LSLKGAFYLDFKPFFKILERPSGAFLRGQKLFLHLCGKFRLCWGKSDRFGAKLGAPKRAKKDHFRLNSLILGNIF